MAVAGRPNRHAKSRSPHRISVRWSACDASGRIEWWNAWAMPVPPPARSSSAKRARTAGASRARYAVSVAPRFHEMWAGMPSSAIGR